MLSLLPRNFVSIVETGSITRAALELNQVKSAVSQNLKKLEEQLGVKLLARTTRQLSLTPAGERYYRHCKDILILSEQARTEMEAFGAKPSGPITITAPHALIRPVIAPAMTTVIKRFPALEPSIIAEDKRLELIAEGIDLSITVGTLPDSGLKTQKIGILHDILCAAPALIADAPAYDDPDFVSWVQSLPYIAHMREPAIIDYTLPTEHDHEPLKLRFKPKFRGNTIDSIANFAREGLGVALLPDISIIDDLISRRLMHISKKLIPEPTSINAVHAYDTLTPISVQETIKAMRETLCR